MTAKKGPPSSLETGKGAVETNAGPTSKNINYSVQLHTEENGLEVKYVTAESGDEAAQKVLAGCSYKNASIRGVTPASDPDPNSLGGERDAGIMYDNAENHGAAINPLGTEANEKAVEGLGKGDVSELKD